MNDTRMIRDNDSQGIKNTNTNVMLAVCMTYAVEKTEINAENITKTVLRQRKYANSPFKENG